MADRPPILLSKIFLNCCDLACHAMRNDPRVFALRRIIADYISRTITPHTFLQEWARIRGIPNLAASNPVLVSEALAVAADTTHHQLPTTFPTDWVGLRIHLRSRIFFQTLVDENPPFIVPTIRLYIIALLSGRIDTHQFTTLITTGSPTIILPAVVPTPQQIQFDINGTLHMRFRRTAYYLANAPAPPDRHDPDP